MIINITPENVRAELIDASFQKSVAAYFFAEALPECQPITPVVKALIGDDNPAITLALIDVSHPQLQSLAIQIGLQALPALVIFKEGRPADAIMGPQQLADAQTFLTPYLPKAEDLLLDSARQHLQQLAFQQAYDAALQAHTAAPDRSDIKFILITACLELQKLSQASQLLSSIPMIDQAGDFQRLQAALELAEQAADSPEIKALEAKLEQTPEDGKLKQELAIQYNQAGRKQEALELLLTLLRQDLAFGDAKKIYLDILATMTGDPQASLYRRHLYTLLY